jgi:hypothetical protein
MPLSTFTTPDGQFQIELRTAPEQPLHIGPASSAELHVMAIGSGQPADDLAISVTTWMPVMGHACAQKPVKVSAIGDGNYVLAPIAASMDGKCELILSIGVPTADGGESPAFRVATPTFVIPKG